MNLSVDVVDNIISYIKPNEKIFINKKEYDKSKIEMQNKINKIQIFYKRNKRRLEMQFEYLEYGNDLSALHSYYILFYPHKFRCYIFNTLMSNLDLIILNNKTKSKIKMIYYKSKLEKNFNKYFKDLIYLLDITQLSYIGW